MLHNEKAKEHKILVIHWGVGLCLLECFEVYHTKLDYTKPAGEEEDSDDIVESIEGSFDPESN